MAFIYYFYWKSSKNISKIAWSRSNRGAVNNFANFECFKLELNWVFIPMQTVAKEVFSISSDAKKNIEPPSLSKTKRGLLPAYKWRFSTWD